MIKKYLKKIFNFFDYIIFGEDLLSFVIFILIIIVLYLILQNSFPYIFSVDVTGSMEHQNFNFYKYVQYNITPKEFYTFPFNQGINIGDINIIVPINYNDIKVGDVILYKALNGNFGIYHRVVEIYYQNGTRYICTIGDNNPGPLTFEKECQLTKNRIIGIGIFRIPYLGYIKLLL